MAYDLKADDLVTIDGAPGVYCILIVDTNEPMMKVTSVCDPLIEDFYVPVEAVAVHWKLQPSNAPVLPVDFHKFCDGSGH